MRTISREGSSNREPSETARRTASREADDTVRAAWRHAEHGRDDRARCGNAASNNVNGPKVTFVAHVGCKAHERTWLYAGTSEYPAVLEETALRVKNRPVQTISREVGDTDRLTPQRLHAGLPRLLAG